MQLGDNGSPRLRRGHRRRQAEVVGVAGSNQAKDSHPTHGRGREGRDHRAIRAHQDERRILLAAVLEPLAAPGESLERRTALPAAFHRAPWVFQPADRASLRDDLPAHWAGGTRGGEARAVPAIHCANSPAASWCPISLGWTWSSDVT